MEEINIKDFLNYLKKYSLMIVCFVLFCVLVIGVYDSFFKVPLYQSNTTVVLVKDDNKDDVESDTINQNDIQINQKLVSTYSEIIKSRLVLNQVIRELNLDYTFEKLYKEISVSQVADTAILKIVVTDKTKENSRNIANKVAEVFTKEISSIYKLNNVSVIDEALTPSSPSNINIMKDIVIIGMLSFAGSIAIVFVIFYFDDTLRSIDDMEEEIKTPVIAKVYKDNNGIDLIVEKKPNAVASESIRTLRTNLQFSSVDEKIKTILITSSVPSEGKSFVAANLASAFAQTGKKVLIVDCDLRKGRQHKIFGVSGKKGLSNLLIGEIEKYKEYVAKTNVKDVYLIPRGIFPPNPSELLNSKKNSLLITLLKKNFDIVILDGAPIIGLSDSLILSSIVDKVLVVSALNYTKKTDLRNTITALNNVNANIAGFVANNLVHGKGGYGYYYYADDEKDK